MSTLSARRRFPSLLHTFSPWTPAFALVVFALVAPFIAPYDPLATDVAHALQHPTSAHWFGTDALGRDLLSRVIVASRLDLAIAFSAVVLSCVPGTLIGAVAGFAGGWFDRATGRVVDALMAFPLFVVAMALVAVLGNSVLNVVIATAIINLPFYVRLSRAEVASRRDAAYVRAARLAGNRRSRVLFAVILPNVFPLLAIQVSQNLGWAIMNGAGLSFLGLGVRPPAAEWGVLVNEGAQYIITGQWWVALFPGIALFVAVLIFTLTGDALRDRLDYRRRV
ncbi:ABC transporter permease [Paraburkholderia xenovorans]|uniref:ABC transporter permease n=1 Tax=Paraburkholderia xenovorans TaxID=36873 RepID=UPI0038BD8355